MDDFSFGDVPALENDDIFNMLFDETNLSPEQLNKSSPFQEDVPIDYGFLDEGFSSASVIPDFENYVPAAPEGYESVRGSYSSAQEGYTAACELAIAAPTEPDFEPQDLNSRLAREFEELFAPLCPEVGVGDTATPALEETVRCEFAAVTSAAATSALESERLVSIESDHCYISQNSPNLSGDEEIIVDVDDSTTPVIAFSPTSSYDYSGESVHSDVSSPLGGTTESMQISDILEQCKSAMDAANKISDEDIEMTHEEDTYPQVLDIYASAKEIRMNANERAPMQYSHVSLTAEEKELLKKEGIVLPEDMPLTKQEDRALRCVRRKIRNKVSAKESRKRKQVYVDGLEKRIKNCTVKNMQLQRKVDILETSNVTLMSQLRKLQTLFTPKHVNKPAQTKTCLMVMLLSLALFAAPNVNQMTSSANHGNQASDPVEQPQTNTGRSRNLLQATKPSLEPMYDDVEEDTANCAIGAAIDKASYSGPGSGGKWRQLQALLNDSADVGRLLRQQEESLRRDLETPLNDLVNETQAALNSAAEAFRRSEAISTEFIDDGMQESDSEELNIKIESALRGNEDVYIDQTSLYDMLATYDMNKAANIPAKKRRRVAV